MKILYFDCFSGISGDMTVGALVDLGVDPAIVEKELSKLNLEAEYRLEWKKVVKKGITSTKMNVILTGEGQTPTTSDNQAPEKIENDKQGKNKKKPPSVKKETVQSEDKQVDPHHHHDHDHEHHHESSEKHTHTHSHDHGHHHRDYKEIVFRIKEAGLNDEVVQFALAIFHEVAMAEGKIHNLPIEKVHFHEVGAIDSIVDIVATAICIHELKPDKIVSAPVPVGMGKIWIDHGMYPVPAPATLEMLKNVPIQESHIHSELTTPTGAAIVKALAHEFGRVPSMEVKEIGYGAGTKDFPDHPNVLRVIMGETFDF